jgi:hypothetical protein
MEARRGWIASVLTAASVVAVVATLILFSPNTPSAGAQGTNTTCDPAYGCPVNTTATTSGPVVAGFKLTMNDVTVVQGQIVIFRACGADPSAEVTFRIDGEEIGRTNADSNGCAALPWTVPHVFKKGSLPPKNLSEGIMEGEHEATAEAVKAGASSAQPASASAAAAADQRVRAAGTGRAAAGVAQLASVRFNVAFTESLGAGGTGGTGGIGSGLGPIARTGVAVGMLVAVGLVLLIVGRLLVSVSRRRRQHAG